jgi:hypothetical protein
MFGGTYIGGPAKRIPISEMRQIENPDLAFLAKARPIQPN